MKKKTCTLINSFLLMGVFLMLAGSCKKSNSPAPTPSTTEVVIAKEVNVISNQTWINNIVSLDSTNFTITLKKGITSTQQIKVGDIIVTAVGEGLLRKVKSVSTVNNEIKVETESAALTDCIKQGVIDINQPLTIKQIKRIDYHYDGIKLINNFKSGGNEPVNLSMNSVLYDLDGNNATTADQIKLNGTLTCDWGFNLKIDVGILHGLKEVKFGVTGSENLDLELVAGMQYNFKKEISLAKVHFGSILTTIGVVPIVITPQLEIIIGIDGSANASLTSKITQSLSFDNGIRFLKDQGWSPYKTFNKNFSFQPPQLNVNASACAYLKPEFLIKIDYVAGPYTNLKIYSRIDADLLQTPWWKLYGGITMNAGAKVNIIDRFTLDYTVSDLINYELMIAQSITPPVQSPTLTTNSVTSITQTTASSGGNVTSDGGATVTARGVCWNTTQTPTTSNFKTTDGSGINTFTSNLTNLTANTTYYVRAYATNSVNTSYGNQVPFTTGQTIAMPTVTTNSITNITQTTASSGGNVTADGGAAVTARGVCWSTTQTPTTNNFKTTDGNGINTFTSNLTGLTANTTYYVRAYATNSAGTTYGNQVTFTTISGGGTGTVTDIDGNVYNTVTIGTQIWMVENLKVTKLNDGTAIPLIADDTAWGNLSTPGYCWYSNDAAYKNTYGTLFNWFTINTGKLAPLGWHVPSDAEWTTLTTYLGGTSIAGGKLKETGTSHWESPILLCATNESGFTALPGGGRGPSGVFIMAGYYGKWWSSTFSVSNNAWYREMLRSDCNIGRYDASKSIGFSVRCIKD